MLIEITDIRPPFDRPPFDCCATVTVGGLVYNVGLTERSLLGENGLAFVDGLQARNPFSPEFGYEPLFNVELEGGLFVTYLYRPRFRHEWLWWLDSIKVVSEPESVTEAASYLSKFTTSLQRS